MKPLLLAALLLASTASAQVQKWEYATYYIYSSTENGDQSTLSIGSKDFRGKLLPDLINDFFGKDAKKYAYLTQGTLFLNYLGSVGWELVTVTSVDNPTTSILTYYFKRPVAK